MINTIEDAREFIRTKAAHALEYDPNAYVDYVDILHVVTDVLCGRAANDESILTINANAIIFFARIDAFYNQTNYRENIERALDYENFGFVEWNTAALVDRMADLIRLLENAYHWGNMSHLSVVCDELIQMLFADILDYFEVDSEW